MSFQQFSAYQYVRTLDTDESVYMGSFDVQDSGELKHVQVQCYTRGTILGTEKVRLKIYSDVDLSSLIATSDWHILDQSNWIGLIRIDFNNENINKNFVYYVVAEINGYTNTFPTLEIGLCYDYPNSCYSPLADKYQETNLLFKIYLERKA